MNIARKSQPDRGWLFDLTGFAGAHGAHVDDTVEKLQFETSALRVELTGADCAIAFTATDGTTPWKEGASFKRTDDGKLTLTRTLAAGESITDWARNWQFHAAWARLRSVEHRSIQQRRAWLRPQHRPHLSVTPVRLGLEQRGTQAAR